MCFIISKLWFWVVLSIANGGGCQVVSMLAFYTNELSLNTADAYIFSVKFLFEITENKK